MTAIFRGGSNFIKITPTANLAAGDVVALGDGLVGVCAYAIPANATGTINLVGEYDVTITAGTARTVGTLVTGVAAKELDGTATTVTFGPCLRPTTTTDTTARCRLVCDVPPTAGN